MDVQTHWDAIYRSSASDKVSWYRPHLEKSLALIERAAGGFSAAIIDFGGGESTLVDDLLARGYRNISVLDVSQTAIDVTKKRLKEAANRVRWIVGDVTQLTLEAKAYEVWHDRAVFHFLMSNEQRAAYVERVAHAVRTGGHVIVKRLSIVTHYIEPTAFRWAFGSKGPNACYCRVE
jgi:2-polyprenyl-3-methyl-5-hydroxy-6-metoxy-1,4-benzoquinol methylase